MAEDKHLLSFDFIKEELLEVKWECPDETEIKDPGKKLQ